MDKYQKSHALKHCMRKITVVAMWVGLALSTLVGCSLSNNKYLSPFGHTYIVDEIVYTKDKPIEKAETLLIQIDSTQTLFICNDVTTYDYSMIGRLEAVATDGDPVNGLWELFTNDQTEQYCLQMEDDGTATLSFLRSEELQWKYRIHRIDVIDCNVMTLGSMTTIYPDWLYPGTFSASLENLIYLSGANISRQGTLQLVVHDESISSLTVYEAYYTDGTVEYNEYILENEYKLSVSARYESGEQFAIYHIPCGGLECWFYLKYA